MVSCDPRLALVLVLAALGGLAASATDLIGAADAAFAAGENERALTLYDEALAADPQDAQALLRSGLLLSWDRRYDEAIARYDRLLAIDPERRDAALARAKVLSWDRRFPDAAGAFRSILDRWPEDKDARLGLARTMSWSGDQAGARAEYARILESDPACREARIGTAQTLAWSGKLSDAEAEYERVLADAPDDRDARLGRAYVRLWSGDAAAAQDEANALTRQYPDDPEVAQLSERAHAATRPWIRTAADHTEDTDNNELNVLAVSAGFPVASHVDAIFVLARYAMRDPTADAEIDVLSAGVDLRPAAGQIVALRVGVDRLESTAGERTNEATGSAAWLVGTDRAWRGSLTAARESVRYSPTITDNGIVIDALRAEGSGRIGDPWRVFASAGIAELSDGNDRVQAEAGFARRLPVRSVQAEAGVTLAGLDYDQDLDHGYFDPSDFRSALAVVRASDTFGARDASWSVEGSWGVQSFTQSGVDVDRDEVFLVSAAFGWPIGQALRLDLRASRGDYAARTPTGFESWQVGLTLRVAVF